jgi:hypothetical protein
LKLLFSDFEKMVANNSLSFIYDSGDL